MPYFERIPLHESTDTVNRDIKYCRLQYIMPSLHHPVGTVKTCKQDK